MTSKNSHSRRLSGTNLGCNKDKDFFPSFELKSLSVIGVAVKAQGLINVHVN